MKRNLRDAFSNNSLVSASLPSQTPFSALRTSSDELEQWKKV